MARKRVVNKMNKLVALHSNSDHVLVAGYLPHQYTIDLGLHGSNLNLTVFVSIITGLVSKMFRFFIQLKVETSNSIEKARIKHLIHRSYFYTSI